MEIMIIVKKDTDLEEHSKNKRATTKQKKRQMKWNDILPGFFLMTVSILYHSWIFSRVLRDSTPRYVGSPVGR